MVSRYILPKAYLKIILNSIFSIISPKAYFNIFLLYFILRLAGMTPLFQKEFSGQRRVGYLFYLYAELHLGLRASGMANKLRSFRAFDPGCLQGLFRHRRISSSEFAIPRPYRRIFNPI
mgnify:FL=1